jgi:hypothetical protein
VLVVTVVTWILRRSWRGGLAAWIAHGTLLAPVSVFAHAGFQLTADRYCYLPGMAAATLVGARVGAGLRAAGQGTRAAAAAVLAAMVWIGGLAILTSRPVSVWRNPESSWGQAVQVDPACAICHDYLGGWLMRQHRDLEGFEPLRRAAALRPDRFMAYGRLFMAYGRLGQAYEQLGLVPEAIAAYRPELAVRPAALEARSAARGSAGQGRPEPRRRSRSWRAPSRRDGRALTCG